MSNCKVHNVRFYRPKPEAIYCMTLHPQHDKVAVSRADARIEIWNISACPFIERSIASSAVNFTVEDIKWCGPRLFSVGLHGLLVEYDLFRCSVKKTQIVTGEAAYCLDINKSCDQIAVGTEQGYLNIFELVEGEVMFKKFLDKQEGQILCLKYDHSCEFIISGGVDAIRIWNVKSGHALHKMTTGRSDTNRPTIVWCLAVTQNFTIISGDSRGHLSFWDGNVGAQIESYKSHRADILTVCLSEDDSNLYCSGVDPNITNYVKISVGKAVSERWVKSINRKIHEHDVKALTLCGKKLYSAGVDGYLACSYHPPKTLLKFPPILQGPCVVLSPEARYVLLRDSKHIDVWSLGQTRNGKNRHNTSCKIDVAPKKLVKIQPNSIKFSIICAAISNNGEWLLYSTTIGIRLLQLSYSQDEDKPQVVPRDISHVITEGVTCLKAIFTDNSKVVVALDCGGLCILNLTDTDISIEQDLNTDSDLDDTITFLIASPCGELLVAADPNSNICVWAMKNGSYAFHFKLPKYQAPPVALALHPITFELVVAYSDNNVIEYDVRRRKLTKFSRSLMQNLPKQWMERKEPIRNITFDPRANYIIILHDDSNVIVINKQKEFIEPSSKIAIVDSPDGKKGRRKKKKLQENESYFKTITKYKHLVHLSWLSDDEMVSVEVDPMVLLEQLPPCLVQPTFGRK